MQEYENNIPVEPETGLTPQEEEELETLREEAWEEKITPYRALKTQINDLDDLIAETLYEVTLLELGMEV